MPRLLEKNWRGFFVVEATFIHRHNEKWETCVNHAVN